MIFKNWFRKEKFDHVHIGDVNYLSGLIESPEDERDYYIGASELGEKFSDKHIINSMPPIRNQRYLNSCASHAIISEIENQMIQKQSYIEMSEQFHFYLARELNGEQDKNVGMTLLDACKVAKNKGLSFEKYCPYSVYHYKEKPSNFAYMVARLLKLMGTYSVKAYYRVYTFDDIKFWINQERSVIAGINTSREFNGLDKDSDSILTKCGTLQGGHAINVIGYRDDGIKALLIRNSWGESWGHEGHIWISYDLWLRICFEARTITI